MQRACRGIIKYSSANRNFSSGEFIYFDLRLLIGIFKINCRIIRRGLETKALRPEKMTAPVAPPTYSTRFRSRFVGCLFCSERCVVSPIGSCSSKSVFQFLCHNFLLRAVCSFHGEQTRTRNPNFSYT